MITQVSVMKYPLANEVFIAAALIMSLYFASPRIIQAQPEVLSGEEGALVLEEIEVTARRRTEALQDAEEWLQWEDIPELKKECDQTEEVGHLIGSSCKCGPHSCSSS